MNYVPEIVLARTIVRKHSEERNSGFQFKIDSGNLNSNVSFLNYAPEIVLALTIVKKHSEERNSGFPFKIDEEKLNSNV